MSLPFPLCSYEQGFKISNLNILSSDTDSSLPFDLKLVIAVLFARNGDADSHQSNTSRSVSFFFFFITVDFTKLISQVQNAPILTSLSFNDLSL